jgi:hypothetical protein
MYHGTSVDNAKAILKEGFRPSTGGELGAGIYMAREDKAAGYAERASGRSHNSVVFKCQFTPHAPKYVEKYSQVGDWRKEGHDAIRTYETGRSGKMEWCVSCPVTILAWRFLSEANTWHGPHVSPA